MIFGGSFLFENCSIISFSEYFKMFWSICQSFWSLVAVPIAHWLDFVSVQTFSFVESGQFWNDYFMLNLALMETILIPRRRDFETWYYCFLLSFTLALMKMLPPWPGPFNGHNVWCINHNVWSTNHNGCYLWEKSPIEMKVSMAKTIAIILGYQCRIPGGARYLFEGHSHWPTMVSDFDCHYQFFSWSVAFSTRTLAGWKARSASVGADEM